MSVYDPYTPVRPAWVRNEHDGLTFGAGVIGTEDIVRELANTNVIACDIETTGVDVLAFQIKVVTFATEHGALALDPRNGPDRVMIREIISQAACLVFHNAPFDIPPLHQAGLITLDQIGKVFDTLVLARLHTSDTLVPKTLTACAKRYLGMTVDSGIEDAFKAAGYKTKAAGYAEMDIDSPVYLRGAMMDTIVTARLWEPMWDACLSTLTTGHPFADKGVGIQEAAQLIRREQLVNQVMMRRSARGIPVDTDFLDQYRDENAGQMDALAAEMRAVNVDPGNGNHLAAYLDTIGALPADYPKTKTGKFSTTAKHLETLEHPLALSFVHHKQLTKVQGYLEKVAEFARVTGRIHPQVGVLGASATGRMAYGGGVPLQQFPAGARPMLLSEAGHRLYSIDWSSIEPTVMANCAGDTSTIAAYESGGDLYAPVVAQTGLTRKVAKTVLLGQMYGQGLDLLSTILGTERDDAARVRDQVMGAMPQIKAFLNQLRTIGNEYGQIITISGRILSIELGYDGKYSGYKAQNYFCVTPETSILTDDLRHVPAKSVSVGDRLVGFDEHATTGAGRGRGRRAYRVATVTDVRRVMKKCVTVTDSDGNSVKCSADHMWLVRRNRYLVWSRADRLETTDELLRIGEWQHDTSHTGGYLAGLYDGEGCLTAGPPQSGRRRMSLVFSQVPGTVMDAYTAGMDTLNLPYTLRRPSRGNTSPCWHGQTSGTAAIMRTLGTLRPHRMMARVPEMYDGHEVSTQGLESTPTVASVEPCGSRMTVAVTTDTHTLVAGGYLSHNCQGSAYDVLAESIVRLDAAGLSDSVVLAMHDELVVDREPVEVRRLMEVPPDALCRWAGRVPMLRTDAADMGHRWASV